jgi:uncharacterized protein (DUF4415 family)
MWGAEFNIAGRQAIEHGISMGRGYQTRSNQMLRERMLKDLEGR